MKGKHEAFWVFSPFGVPAPALVHVAIFHHFITKLPLKPSEGYFKRSEKGRVRAHKFSWHWWETNGGAGDVGDSGTMKSRVPFFFFFYSPSKWALNFHKIFKTFLQWPLPFPSNFATPATEARQQRATLSFTKMRSVGSFLPSLLTWGKVTL